MEIEKKIQIWRVKNQIGLLTEMNCVLETLPSCWKILWKKIIENAGFSAKLRYVKGCGCHYMRVFGMESPPRENRTWDFPKIDENIKDTSVFTLLPLINASLGSLTSILSKVIFCKPTYQILYHQSLIAD